MKSKPSLRVTARSATPSAANRGSAFPTSPSELSRAAVFATLLAGITAVGCSGDDGAPGENGLHCYEKIDANGDVVGIDRNGDAQVDTEDCQGPKGDPGVSCFEEVDENGTVVGVDRNGDGKVDTNDCQGPKGDPGQNGQNGQNGLHCYQTDEDGNGIADGYINDNNGDGVVNTEDCGGSTPDQGGVKVCGLYGPTGQAQFDRFAYDGSHQVAACKSAPYTENHENYWQQYGVYCDQNCPTITIKADELIGNWCKNVACDNTFDVQGGTPIIISGPTYWAEFTALNGVKIY